MPVWTRRAALAALGSVLAPAGVRASRPVTFGLTAVFLHSDLQLNARIEAYLSQRIGRPALLVKRRTYQEITALLLAGQLDAAWICGLPLVQHRAELSVLAVPVYRGAPLYRSYLVARHDRPARELTDLRGDIHAFSDPDSNSGYLVTRAAIAELGESPDRFFSRTFFTHGHRNVIRAVAAGLAHSGSVDGYVWDVMSEIEPALVGATRLVRVSPPMGFPPVAASRHTDPGLAAALQAALLDMAASPAGRAVLATLRLDGFVAGSADLFDMIEALWRRTRAAG